MKDFDIEKLERKNIYKVPDHLFDTIQDRVFAEVKAEKKAPIFKLNWAFAVAASLALIFGATFLFDSDNGINTDSPKTNIAVDSHAYTSNTESQMSESEKAYETLKSDLTSIEKDNQTIEDQGNKVAVYSQSKKENKTVKNTPVTRVVSRPTEAQMNEYLDAFSSSEISELANNSAQDVYLDLYN
ncbi:hypothetical protein [Chryseobacterium sp.]|uniref:hypothetical protein n=1 Tax=Chryseobacterium sp. TaxID=1871047 RepID=UPI0025B8AF86|nr:hypothetical protein [Chryseobacterium sp.]